MIHQSNISVDQVTHSSTLGAIPTLYMWAFSLSILHQLLAISFIHLITFASLVIACVV